MCESALVFHSDQVLDLGLATQKKIGQSPLDKLEAWLRRHDLSNATTLLINVERFIFLSRRQLVKDISEGGRFYAKQHGKTVEALDEFKTGY
jgi:hypothetical protein